MAAPRSEARPVLGSIFVGQHHGDGGRGVVHVERAALRDEFHQPGRAVVGVAHVEGNGDAM